MAEALTTLARLLIVRENHEDENGTTLCFQRGDLGHIALSDANYETYLRLAQRSQERQHPVGVSFGEGHSITKIIRADNDRLLHLGEDAPDHLQVIFQGHDGVFRLGPNHPESARICELLGESLRQKTRIWFIAQKPDLFLLDVQPA